MIKPLHFSFTVVFFSDFPRISASFKFYSASTKQLHTFSPALKLIIHEDARMILILLKQLAQPKLTAAMFHFWNSI